MWQIKSPPQSDGKNYKFELVWLLKNRLGSLKLARRKTAFVIYKAVNHKRLILLFRK